MKRKLIFFLKNMLGLTSESKIAALKKRGMSIGKNFSMMQGCIIDPSHFWHITIGDNVTFAPRVHILAHDASTKLYLNYSKVKNVIIGNNVFVGAGCIIMPGVTIEDNVIVGAGSIVTKKLEANALYAGNPAKFICYIHEYFDQQKQLMKAGVNLFEKEYTLSGNISLEKMNEMKRIIDKEGVGFVY
ncbi:maltose O-acetyltransferase [Filimonas lacunae]|uniref:Maltose O-acetyltransferase n=1 Tax=Filimonas lacunae TaxID=477680 RepID=A0A173MNA2_9BACT|nr:acyltransferase [Filimonas lacunae]BAV09135.1 maltose O-acetyltransferase [Filimonas lacunae]SIS67781.1 maltose O-acetyltransferase [Filimonas lacunae]